MTEKRSEDTTDASWIARVDDATKDVRCDVKGLFRGYKRDSSLKPDWICDVLKRDGFIKLGVKFERRES